MDDAETLRLLRGELARAMRAPDRRAAFEAPSATLPDAPSLLRAAVARGALTEAHLNALISAVTRPGDDAVMAAYVGDDALGHPSVRAFWGLHARFARSDPALTLAEIRAAYRACDPRSIMRSRFVHLIFGQSYRERDWSFVLPWMETATDGEVAGVPGRFLYGAMIGLANDGRAEAARDAMARAAPHQTALQRLYLEVPRWRADPARVPRPDPGPLLDRLVEAMPAGGGTGWAWFHETYRDVLGRVGTDRMGIRTDPAAADALRADLLAALSERRPLAFQRMGDGEPYRRPLPDVAAAHADAQAGDDSFRERAWWGRDLPASLGDLLAERVRAALREADVLGFVSPYRLVRDAVPGVEWGTTYLTRALMAHLHALDTDVEIERKVATEDRAHTILYTRPFLEALVAAADRVVVLGSLSPAEMRLPGAERATFLALTPQRHHGLPTAPGARGVVEHYDAIAADLRAACGPGTLALVSGGYVGKALVAEARRAGAVALDIGSRADRLAGRETRSPADAV